MIAPDTAAQAAFLAILPSVERHARVAFRHLNPSDREEAAAEAVAHAWVAFLRLWARGKDPARFPTALARFSALAARNGRRVGGRVASRDVMSAVRREAGVRVARSREEEMAGGTPAADLLPADARGRVPDLAAFRVDFPAWLRRLTAGRRQAARLLAAGYGTGEVASGLGVTAGRVSQLRRELAADWHNFHAGGKPGSGRD
ncbi:MAG: hypothetical protein K2X87_27035 [Gemmataceae bacterium]|nr:hypothetical protein [Gemmataceae bacterium]